MVLRIVEKKPEVINSANGTTIIHSNCFISLTLDTRRECDGKPMPVANR